MASVTFPVAIGGDGSTVSDDSNPATGLANGGHRTRFVPACGQVVEVAKFMVPIAENALNAPGTSATSVSSMSIGTGSRSLTLAQVGKTFAVGQWVQLTDTAAPATNYMVGAVTAFNAGTGAMTVNVQQAAGSGTLTSWAVHPASPLRNAFQVVGADGSLALTSTGTLGYGAGAGGTVTQITSKATPVTLNRPSGRITTHNASLAAGAWVEFSVNCSSCGVDDVPVLALTGSAPDKYLVKCNNVAAGVFTVAIKNDTGGALAEALSVRFAVIKAATS